MSEKREIRFVAVIKLDWMQLLNSSVEKKRKIVADLKRYYMHQKRKSKKKIPMK